MNSNLFHTIVGVGIALGAASTACSSRLATTNVDAPEEPRGTTYAASTGPDPTPMSGDPRACDGGVADSGSDASIFDAFCDASWPTTKGGVIPPDACIDPKSECTGVRPFTCAPTLSEGVCQAPDPIRGSWFLSVCIAGTWTCKPGRIPVDACACVEWEPGSCDPAADAGARRP